MKLLRRTKLDYYGKIDLGKLTDNHKFWKTVKPLFSDKVQVNASISLIEDGKISKSGLSNWRNFQPVFRKHHR